MFVQHRCQQVWGCKKIADFIFKIPTFHHRSERKVRYPMKLDSGSWASLWHLNNFCLLVEYPGQLHVHLVNFSNTVLLYCYCGVGLARSTKCCWRICFTRIETVLSRDTGEGADFYLHTNVSSTGCASVKVSSRTGVLLVSLTCLKHRFGVHLSIQRPVYSGIVIDEAEKVIRPSEFEIQFCFC